MRNVLIGCAALVASGCGDDAACYIEGEAAEACATLDCAPAGGAGPVFTDPVTVVPSDTMPATITSLLSHNNLDIVWHGDRLYFAFRTGASHFASEEVSMYIVSTQDQVTWTHEATIELGRDVREPRFLSYDGRLFLYFAVLGDVPVLFEPQYAMVTEYQGPCGWTEPERILPELDGFIPWRTKTVDGTAYMMGYIGGENIYQPDGEPVRVHWFTTEDGRTFEPVVAGQPIVLEGGASETDFVFTDDGGIVAVARNELGDADGWGSKICRAEAGDLGTWTCAQDPKKYDSPILFRHGDAIYLIARRQLANDGNYDLMRRDLPPEEQASIYNQAYWVSPKRCALWRVDGEALTVEHLLDLPSAGDTCFPGVVPLEGDTVLVYNYTSPIDEPDLKWYAGQTGPTSIYRTNLTLP